MELTHVLEKRKSRRHYLKTPVPRESIEAMMRAAQQAPSSCNLQLGQYLVVDDATLLDRLAKDVSYKFAYAPCCIVVIHDPRFTVERTSSVVGLGMAVENMILTAESHGLSTCPMAGFGRDERIKNILGIPKALDILLLLTVGYPDLSFDEMPVPRIPCKNTYAFNRYEHLPLLNDSPFLEEHTVADIISYRSRIAPVYLDRLRLHTLKEGYYAEAVSAFRQALAACTISSGTILDLMSYDGQFLAQLHPHLDRDAYTVIVSDYLEIVRSSLSKTFSARAVTITDTQRVEDIEDNSLDAISFVFQAECTPRVASLLTNAVTKLRTGGVLFIATHQSGFFRKVRNYIRRSLRVYVYRKPYNLYEGNPFYKVGPILEISKDTLISALPEMYLKDSSRVQTAQDVTLQFLTFIKK